MSIKDIMPWRRKEEAEVPVRRFEEPDSVGALRRDLDNLFENFLAPYSRSRGLRGLFGEDDDRFIPSVDISEDSGNVMVSMEIPGVEPKDVEVVVDAGNLIVRGEKKREKESEEEDYYHYERSYGGFQRSIPLPEGIDRDNVKATFNNGVLKVKLPRSREANRSRKKIEITE